MTSKSKRVVEVQEWRVDQNDLLRRRQGVFVSADAVVRDEILSMRHDDSLNEYFDIQKTLTLLRQDFY